MSPLARALSVVLLIAAPASAVVSGPAAGGKFVRSQAMPAKDARTLVGLLERTYSADATLLPGPLFSAMSANLADAARLQALGPLHENLQLDFFERAAAAQSPEQLRAIAGELGKGYRDAESMALAELDHDAGEAVRAAEAEPDDAKGVLMLSNAANRFAPYSLYGQKLDARVSVLHVIARSARARGSAKAVADGFLQHLRAPEQLPATAAPAVAAESGPRSAKISAPLKPSSPAPKRIFDEQTERVRAEELKWVGNGAISNVPDVTAFDAERAKFKTYLGPNWLKAAEDTPGFGTKAAPAALKDETVAGLFWDQDEGKAHIFSGIVKDVVNVNPRGSPVWEAVLETSEGERRVTIFPGGFEIHTLKSPSPSRKKTGIAAVDELLLPLGSHKVFTADELFRWIAAVQGQIEKLDPAVWQPRPRGRLPRAGDVVLGIDGTERIVVKTFAGRVVSLDRVDERMGVGYYHATIDGPFGREQVDITAADALRVLAR